MKRKKVRKEKYKPGHVLINFNNRKSECITALNRAEAEHRKLIFFDEICFTKRSFQSQDWSVKGDHQHVDQNNIFTGYRTVIASVSRERGLEYIRIYRTAIKAEQFIGYLQQLRRNNGGKSLAIFMDNLAVHRDKTVKP